MKRLMLGWVVVVLCVFHVEAKSQGGFFDSIKSKSKDVLLASKAALVYVVSCVREPNSVKIKKAIEAKEAISQMGAKLKIGMDGEGALLQNVHALGFDKKNATKALELVKSYYEAMSDVIYRFQSMLTPWNKSTEMQMAVDEIVPYAQTAQLYVVYFESHHDCLNGWEFVERYTGLCSLDVNNEKEVIAFFTKIFENNGKDNFLNGVDALSKSTEWLKKLFLNIYFKQTYSELHDQLYSIFPRLILFIEAVKKSSLYASQLKDFERKGHKGGGKSSSKSEVKPYDEKEKITPASNVSAVGVQEVGQQNEKSEVVAQQQEIKKEAVRVSSVQSNDGKDYWPKIFNDAEKYVDSAGKPF